MKKNRNIIKIFQTTVLTFFAFFIFGAINVDAETVMVYDKDTFTNEFSNITNTSDIIQLANDIDMSDIKYEQVLSIYKDKTIDLKGNTLIIPNMRLSVLYNANATVKFIDSSSGKTGKILGADDSTGDYPLITVFTDASLKPEETYLVFDGVKIERNTDVGGKVIGSGTNGTKINKLSFINSDIVNFYALNGGGDADNFYYENITFKRDRSVSGYLMNSSEKKIKDVISADSEVVNLFTNGNVEKIYSEDDLMSTVTTYSNILKVRYKDGFTVSNVNLKETLGYTSSTSVEIPITNRGTTNLTIVSVSVDDLSKFEIIPGNKTDLEAGKTDKSWKIKARDGVSAGTYKAVITVTGNNTKTYTGEVTLEVEEYEDGYKTIYATSFDELKDAIGGVKYNSDGIIVTDTSIRKVKLGANIEIPDKKSLKFNIINDFVLDLNGYTIDGYTNDRSIMLAYGNNGYEDFDSASLTIIDSSSSQSGTINLGSGAIEIQQFNINDNNKNYKLIINGGKYYQKYGQEHYFINFANNDTYWKNKKISFDFKVNKGYFEFKGDKGKLLLAQSFDENEQNVNLSISFNNVTLKGRNSYLLYANDKEYTYNDITPEGTDLYIFNSDGKQKLIDDKTISAKASVPSKKYISDSDFSVGYYAGLKISRKQGFEVTAPTFDKVKYGYPTVTHKSISITNIGENSLGIQNVTVNSEDGVKFNINTGSAGIVEPNATELTWMIYPVEGLSAGTHEAVITVIDANNNSYTTSVKFVVEPKELADLGIGGVNSTIEYGTDYTPTLTGTTELGTTDYEVKYAEKIGEDAYGEESSSKPKNVGDYKVTIKVTNSNYNAPDISTFYTIIPKTITPTISVDGKTYTGSEIIPIVNVYNGSTILHINKDYTIEFANNTNVGDAEVIIRPVDGSNYTFDNPTKKTFKIYAKPLTDDSINITLEQTSFTHTGDEIKPEPVVKDGEKTLELGTDYTLSYSNNKNIGNSAVVKVTGKGNYKGEVTKNFSIIEGEPQVLNFAEASVTKTYGASDFTIKVNHTTGDGTVKYTSSNTDVAEVNETTGLVTIKKVGTATIKATASATADYAQTEATYTLTVQKKEISIERATANGKTYDGTKTAEVNYVIFKGLLYGDELKKDVDYEATAEFENETNGYNKPVIVKVVLKDTAKANNYNLSSAEYQTRATISGKAIEESWITVDTTTTYTYDGTEKEPSVTIVDGTVTLERNVDYELVYKDNINAGTASIEIKGIYNYSGTITKTFTINKKSINPVISDIEDVTYNGEEQKPNITVTSDGVTLNPNTDYNSSYINNVESGIGTVNVTEKENSNYTFNKVSKNFVINKYKIKDSDVTLQYSSVLYDGTPKKPTIVVKMGNKVIEPIDYNVTYDKNTSVGTADVLIEIKVGVDNYEGSVLKHFEIVNKTLVNITGITDQTVEYTGSPVVLNGNLAVDNGLSIDDLEIKWYKDDTEISRPTNVGSYKVIYSYESETHKGSLIVNFEITKKTSTVPSTNSYKGIVGDKLSTITLPNGFKWLDSNELITAGNKEYNATYTTNNDTTNYTTETIMVEVYGKSKFNLNTSVNGLGGTISDSKTDILEGTTETIIFTPDTGFEISKVLVNGVDKTSSVANNKLDVVIDNNDINVVVTYKVIEYTITINDVANVTINPSGIIKVDYNSNKEFTIKANQGYKLVSVKVNGVERISDIINDKLTLENILADTEIVVVAQKNVYEVIEGANQKYIITKNTEAKFKVDADYSKFENGGSVYVDAVLLDSSNYTAKSGSTIITLNKDYVDSLSEGEHTLKVVFNDGEASTTFVVAKVSSNPQTGDNIIFYILSSIISVLTFVITGTYLYKRKQTN